MNGRTLSRVTWWLVSLTVAIVLVGPFFIMIAASLQKSRTYFVGAWDWFPRQPTLQNYELIFTRSAVLRWTVNSLLISTIPVAVSVMVSLAAGYIFARKQFRGREPMFWLLLSSLMVPFQVTLTPLYLMMNRIGWIDTYWVLMVPSMLSVTGIFLMRQFVQTIPITLEEAAELDGCNPWQVLRWVIAPLSKTAIATLATLGFISAWNSFLYPLIFTASEKMRPLTVGLSTFADTSGSFGINMAAATINFLPTLVIFLFFQRYFVKGIAMGGVKL
ncbi:MAG: carbohydrate ABC transporter permease [Candidatus Sumerlaeaceae bacterium]